MAKSLFNQFAQIRGSRTYDDQLTVAYGEMAGRAKTSGQTVDISGTAVTNYSDTFQKRDVGNYLVIGGSAYEITAYGSATAVTLGSAPGNGTGVSVALHYFQNLEDTNISARVGYWDVSEGYNISDSGLVVQRIK